MQIVKNTTILYEPIYIGNIEMYNNKSDGTQCVWL